MLTRFTFHVKAGSPSAAGNGTNTDPVKVTSISVEGKNKGQLTVAYTGAEPQSLLTFEDTTAPFKLMQRQGEDHNSTLKDLTPTALTWTAGEGEGSVGAADNIAIGEALLVAPGEESYTLNVGLSQKVLKMIGSEKEDMKLNYTATFQAPNGKFEAGKSYDINITVYGLEKIDVRATLTPWENGGSIDIDDDQK